MKLQPPQLLVSDTRRQPSTTVSDMPNVPTPIPAELTKIRDDLAAALAQDKAQEEFDVDTWLQEWLRLPQPALGGVPPMELLVTPGGVERVVRILGSLMSSSYQ